MIWVFATGIHGQCICWTISERVKNGLRNSIICDLKTNQTKTDTFPCIALSTTVALSLKGTDFKIMCFRVKKKTPSNKSTQNHLLVWSEEKDFEHLVCVVNVQHPLLAVMKIVQDIFWLPVNLSLLVWLLRFAFSLMLRLGIWIEGGWRAIAQAAKTRWIEEMVTFGKGQWGGQVKIQKSTQRGMCERTPVYLLLTFTYSFLRAVVILLLIFIKIACIKKGRMGWHIVLLLFYFKIRNFDIL